MASASERSPSGLSRAGRGLRAGALAALVALPLLFATGCASWFGGSTLVVEEDVLRVPIRIEVRDPDAERAGAAIRAALRSAEDAGKRLLANRKTSHFGLLNEMPADTFIQLTPVGFEATQAAVRVASITGGTYTPARHVLLEAWGLNDGATPRVPSDEEIEDAILRSSWKRLRLKERKQHVARRGQRTVIDLEGVALGTMLDRALDTLEKKGVPSALVSTGGASASTGGIWAGYRADGDPDWLVPVTALGSGDRVAVVAEVALPQASALAIVHAREVFVSDDGTRIHEWINPRTGRPVEGVGTAGVVAPRASIAAGLAVGAFMLGDAAPVMLTQRPGSEWILWTTDGGPRNSTGLTVRWLNE